MPTVVWTSAGGTCSMRQSFWTKRGAKKFLRQLTASGRKGRIV